jgi:hypothetical protein
VRCGRIKLEYFKDGEEVLMGGIFKNGISK